MIIVAPIVLDNAFGETTATVTLEKSFTVDADPREATPRGLTFNDDGTKMYFVGGTRDKIYEYHLSTPFEIDTAVNSGSHKSTSGVDNQPRSIAWQDNGKRMLLAGVATDKIWSYKLQSGGSWTPFDVSTASRDGNSGFDPDDPEINDWGITWSADGTKLFVTASPGGTQKVFQYGFNQGFLLGQYDGNGSVEFELDFDATAREIKFNPDGTKMFIIDGGSIPGEIAIVHEFELSTGFDISTASKIISQTGTTSSFSVLDEEVRPRGLAFNNDGTKMYITGITGLANAVNPDIHQYSLSCPWQLTGTCGEKKGGSRCPDCVPPSISKRGLAEIPDGFKINDEIISVKKYTNNPTQPYEVNVGDPVTFSLRAYENSGPMNIIFSALYMDMHGKSISRYDSSAYVRYHMDKQSFEVVDKDKIFSAIGVSHDVTNPYPDIPKQEMMDITFTVIFAKPMETSHIVMELWDDKRNPEWINIHDALKVSEIPVVEETIPETIPEVPKEPEIQIETKPIPEAPLEPEPEPAPLPDEEIILTEVEPEKSILSFVDTSKEPNHYVKRYVTETEYKEWFDTNYPDYTIWEAVGITQHEYDAIAHKIESEPKLILISEPHYYMEAEKEPQKFELEETYEPEPSPRKSVQEKNDFWSWFFSIFS